MKNPVLTQLASYEAIFDALDKGQNTEATLLLRNQVERTVQLLKESGAQSGFLHRDLEIARKVQKASLPQQFPVIPGLSCETFYRPAHSIGGDYYDFLALDDRSWGIAIGDVSGKGIGAALVLATLQASLRAQTLHLHPRPNIETLMRNVGRLVHESSPAEFFASLFYAEYRPTSRLLRYVNAGHNPPIVVRRSCGRCDTLTLHAGGMPVGMLNDSRYQSTTVILEPDDVLVAYTDGITESENSRGHSFGHKRLENVLCHCTDRDPKEILQNILDEVFAHSAGCSQADDMTLVVIRVQARGEGIVNTISGRLLPRTFSLLT